MPTINQLVRKPRSKVTTKSKSPALNRVVNNLKTKSYEKAAPVTTCKNTPLCWCAAAA